MSLRHYLTLWSHSLFFFCLGSKWAVFLRQQNITLTRLLHIFNLRKYDDEVKERLQITILRNQAIFRWPTINDDFSLHRDSIWCNRIIIMFHFLLNQEKIKRHYKIFTRFTSIVFKNRTCRKMVEFIFVRNFWQVK